MHAGSFQLPFDSAAAARQAHDPVTSFQERAERLAQNGPAPGWQGGRGCVKKQENSSVQRPGTVQLTDLPYDMVRHIGGHVDVRPITSLAQTGHYLNDAVHDMAADKMACHYCGPPGSLSRRQKALFLLYDPYALPASSHNPGQRPSHHAYRPFCS